MGIYDSRQWASDLDEVVDALPELEELSGRRIMITGCAGLICSAVADTLIRWNTRHSEKILILAAGRSKKRIESRFAPYSGEDWFTFVPYDASSTENVFDLPCDYIIHGAGNASPNKVVKEPVETMLSNFMGLKYLLDYAKDVSARRVLYISSSEVYGKKEGNLPYKTDEYGYIDLLNARNSYSVGKRAAETLCASYAAEYGVKSVIIRPGHIYGPTALETDNRVSSAWAYAAARGEDITMKSDGAQLRSYCYCLDGASAILKALLKGEDLHAYNISNPDSVISIREMGEILARSAGTELKREIPTEEDKRGFNPMSNSSLDGSELLALGWKGLFDAERGFGHTVSILREIDAAGKQ
ncbi:MAG: NAD-dependent epimerase/dehydratase family protein [Oscillospiraceae bacterium]|nr:NAD-dependent epimerase/dehydratase family protein [Oscillospiraceae bacterium]